MQVLLVSTTFKLEDVKKNYIFEECCSIRRIGVIVLMLNLALVWEDILKILLAIINAFNFSF
jgi:hypothetical protein